jgi:pimeloyl-ACP methyl ester carboxylesterase
VPERIAAMVYVDTAPGKPPLDPGFAADEKPLVWGDVAAEENLDGLSEAQLATFRERAVPVPGALLREGYAFMNDARRDIPSTIIATGYPAADYQKAAKEHPEWTFLAGIPELHDITWIDLPTSHWPMWSRPAEVAAIIGDVATKADAADGARTSR